MFGPTNSPSIDPSGMSDAVDVSWNAQRAILGEAVTEPIVAFFTGSEDPPRRSRTEQREKAISFFSKTHKDDLQRGTYAGADRPLALVDDGSGKGSGPLTASALYKWRLEKHPPENSQITSSAEAGARRRPGKPFGQNVGRQTIFVTDPDCWSFLALTETVPQYQIGALRAAIEKYLAFRPSIEVAGSLSTPQFSLRSGDGSFKPYQLECHLPFYALGDGPSDFPRTARTEGGILRRSIDLSFLSASPSLELNRLHESQVSIVMVGTGLRRSTTYCFVDTYCDVDGESVTSYAETIGQPFREDPLTMGKTDANKPFTNLKTCFLKYMEVRLGDHQVVAEWRRTIQYLERRINTTLMSFSQGGVLGGKEEVGLEQTQSARNWAVMIRNLLTELEQKLNATTIELDRFLDNADFFSGVDSEGLQFRNAIRSSAKELSLMHTQLKGLQERCNNFRVELQLHLDFGNIKFALSQQMAASENKFYVMVFTPVILSTAIYSMQPGVVPWPVTFGSFTLVVLVFSVLVFAVLNLMSRPGFRAKIATVLGLTPHFLTKPLVDLYQRQLAVIRQQYLSAMRARDPNDINLDNIELGRMDRPG